MSLRVSSWDGVRTGAELLLLVFTVAKFMHCSRCRPLQGLQAGADFPVKGPIIGEIPQQVKLPLFNGHTSK